MAVNYAAVVPLEKRTIDVVTGETKKVETKSILDLTLKVAGKFTAYKPLPSLPKSVQSNAIYEECHAKLKCIDNDLKWLLGLPYGKFWCQVINDERLHRCLDTYLRYSPRFYDNDNLQSNDEMCSIHRDIHRRVFLVFLRMSKYREDEENFMSVAVFADIIYEYFIFDIPLMMDLCILYGRSNRRLLMEMIENVFNSQPKYNHDLDGALASIVQVFDTIAAQCDVAEDDVALPPKLDLLRTGSFISQPDRVVADLVDYLFDVCQSLTAFFDIYRPALQVCYTHHIFSKLAWFYNNVIPVLKTSVLERDFRTLAFGDSVKDRIRGRLSQSRALLIKLVRNIIYEGTIQKVLSSDADIVGEHVEAFLQIMTSMLNERKFIVDYQAKYPFREDVEIIKQTSYKIDETRLAYINEAVIMPDSTKAKRAVKTKRINLKFKMSKEEQEKMKRRTVHKGRSAIDRSETEVPIANGYSDVGVHANANSSGCVGSDLDMFGACAAAVTGVELDSLISSIRDLFPHLGECFIERCLDEYNYDQSAVVDAILTDTLRPKVRDLDRNMSRPKKAERHSKSGADLLADRKNVFDGDEFDVFSRPETVDLSRVTRGKKCMGEESTNMVLNDHSEIERYRELFDRYATIDQDGDAFTPEAYNAEYDDEYDDTYDSADVGAMLDADEIEENFKIQPLNEKKGPRRFYAPQADEEEEENPRSRNQFVVDPAKLRELRERRIAAQRGQTTSIENGVTNGAKAENGAKKYDVVGRPKGHGQEKNVVKNRDYKDKNKARMANHNRRAMADKKKAKGMY